MLRVTDIHFYKSNIKCPYRWLLQYDAVRTGHHHSNITQPAASESFFYSLFQHFNCHVNSTGPLIR